MKIIELFLDPDALEGGVDLVSLVDKPAHESNFLTFNTDLPDVPTQELTYIGEMFDIEDQIKLAELVNSVGEPVGTLENDGWVIQSVEPVYSLKEEVEKELIDKKFDFEIINQPNQPSAEDTPNRRVRYKYVVAPGRGAPIIDTSRTFCKDMLRTNRVFRIEDLIAMTEDCANTEFGCYDLLTWRGSYNCRHIWVKVVYGKIGPIIGATRPLETSNPAWAQPSTQVFNEAQIKEEFGVLAMIDGQPLFSNVEDALKLAEILGCEGYHEHQIGDYTGYMACETHQFQSYDDYPQEASENACKVLRWIDEHGRDEVSGMELTGLARANQLCKKEPISPDTIARMASFARHRKNSEIAPEFKGTPWKDKGYVAWLGWGGDAGIAWAERKLEQIKTEMGLEDACYPGYVAIGTKDLDGREVPNCVPENEMGSLSGIGNDGGCCYDYDIQASPYVDQGTTGKTLVSQYGFSYDEEKMEITGAAIIPNKMIVRRNPITEELYYVFFSTQTTKILSERFMRNTKMEEAANLNHTSTMAPNTFVSESWLVLDPKNDKSSALGMDYPEGTWVITMKVGSEELWKRIKKGEYNGYSIEGYFNERVVFN